MGPSAELSVVSFQGQLSKSSPHFCSPDVSPAFTCIRASHEYADGACNCECLQETRAPPARACVAKLELKLCRELPLSRNSSWILGCPVRFVYRACLRYSTLASCNTGSSDHRSWMDPTSCFLPRRALTNERQQYKPSPVEWRGHADHLNLAETCTLCRFASSVSASPLPSLPSMSSINLHWSRRSRYRLLPSINVAALLSRGSPAVVPLAHPCSSQQYPISMADTIPPSTLGDVTHSKFAAFFSGMTLLLAPGQHLLVRPSAAASNHKA